MKSRMNQFILISCFVSVAFGHDSYNKGDIEDYTKLKYKAAIATRTEDPPEIDGHIDDAAWEKAILVDEFLQFEPYNLEAPTVRTEFRVLYDDEYLYVAFDNFDPNPEKIMARMARRDDWEEGFEFNSDWVGFGIDSSFKIQFLICNVKTYTPYFRYLMVRQWYELSYTFRQCTALILKVWVYLL